MKTSSPAADPGALRAGVGITILDSAASSTARSRDRAAITAMTLAGTTAEPGLHEGHRLWPHIQSWAGELGLTAPDAIARASQPPSDPTCQHEQASRQPDREAAD